jgi:hypothetical protein
VDFEERCRLRGDVVQSVDLVPALSVLSKRAAMFR